MSVLALMDGAVAQGTAAESDLGHQPSEVEAFAALYAETFDAVYRYACALTADATVAEDVAADVYLRAWRKRDSFRGDGKPLSWLLSITHNCATSIRRGSSREVVTMDVLETRPAPARGPESTALASSQRHILMDAIRKLTLEQQHVLILRFFQEWSHAEIAAQLGRKETAVRALQYRALKRLRKFMEHPDAE